MFSSPFSTNAEISIPDDAEIVFVSDMFSSDYLGGAELTTDALIDSSPYNTFRLHSKDVNEKILTQGLNKFWIFGNFTGMNLQLIPTIVGNLRYSIVEYDYKYCRYRSPEKHFESEGKQCDCHNEMYGKMISALYCEAKSLWWMSERQMKRYHDLFPFLSNVKNVVLSSVFDEQFFQFSSQILEEFNSTDTDRAGWVVLGSTSWIKGTDLAESWCKENDKEYEVISNLSYSEVLRKLVQSEGFVYLPRGDDTCPRMVIEAKLLGCNLVLNDHVQHVKEAWFDTDNQRETVKYLYSARERFWKGIKAHLEYQPTVSGYITTMNCIEQDYPFEASIGSMLDFCEQVVIVDGGSTDGTWERILELSDKNEKLLIHQQTRDWNHTRFAVFDGLQKSLARALCTGEFCWQQDCDEVVHTDDYSKIKELAANLPKNVDLVALPVIEFWGGKEKVRIDITPWKWRLSRNRPHITHGIPSHLRKFDENGNLYASPGTDGCDYVRSDTYEPIPFANFYTEEAHNIREQSLLGNNDALKLYTSWLSDVSRNIPSVYHYSWFDIGRKIRTYRNYWSTHWQSLYNIVQKDTADNNMFFDKPWSKVTEDEIDNLASRLSSEMGGWIFHTKLDFSKKTPHISLSSDHPKHIISWMKR